LKYIDEMYQMVLNSCRSAYIESDYAFLFVCFFVCLFFVFGFCYCCFALECRR